MIDLDNCLSGDKLNAEDRAYVLRAYVYRHNPDHCSAAKPTQRPFGFTHASDSDWLRNTLFQVRKNGRLDHRTRSCLSTPTWPFNPEYGNNKIVA